MLKSIRDLDRILRGEMTNPDAVKTGKFDFPVASLTCVIVVLAMIYGASMGTFSLFKEIDPNIGHPSDRAMQVLASTVKVPALFLLTLLVTFPSLYVFNAIVGSRINIVAMLKLLIASLAVNLAVLASLGPITAFFSVSTTSYRFMQLFNVAIFGISGFLGLQFLVQTLNRLYRQQEDSSKADPSDSSDDIVMAEQIEEGKTRTDGKDSVKADVDLGALDRVRGEETSRHVKIVFRIWIVAFGLVGAQMGWILRPFIGNPDVEFTWFRARHSNFFEAILHILGEFLTGG